MVVVLFDSADGETLKRFTNKAVVRTLNVSATVNDDFPPRWQAVP